MGVEATKKLGKSVLIVANLLVVAFTLSAVFPLYPDSSALRKLISLGLPILLVFNAILGVYLLIKHSWAMGIINLLAVVCNIDFIGTVIQIRKTPTDAEYNIKIATYNVHSFQNDFQGYFSKKIAKYMNESSVNVVCMQEYFSLGKYNVDSINADFSKYYRYRVISNDAEGKPAGMGVFSNYPIKDAVFIPFKDSKTNNAMYCDIAITEQRIVRVFNVHLQTSGVSRNLNKSKRAQRDIDESLDIISSSLLDNMSIRSQQSELIYKMAEKSPYPVIIAGDFNSIPSNYPYYLMTSHFVDGFKECGSGYMYTYRGFQKLLRIDYIYHSDKIKGLRYYSEDKTWSDHNPVLMELLY